MVRKEKEKKRKEKKVKEIKIKEIPENKKGKINMVQYVSIWIKRIKNLGKFDDF